MTFSDLDWIGLLLRTAVYIATIASAGGMFFYVTVAGSKAVSIPVRNQIWFGAALLLLVEPMRYVQFQLAIGGGDVATAFDPSMRWMAFETPIGQAALVRVVGGAILVLAGLRLWPLSLMAALAIVASFTLEGHTASHEGAGWLPACLIMLHLISVHWWLGALFPLRAATRIPGDARVADLVGQFGKLALIAVAVLAAAGALLMAVLAGWQVDVARNHQIVFMAKLVVFAAIMAVASINKLRWTPMLVSDAQKGRSGFREALHLEIVLCFFILLITAIMTSFGPSGAF